MAGVERGRGVVSLVYLGNEFCFIKTLEGFYAGMCHDQAQSSENC
jgi:hypothetical protein